jgi:hypothetical protein
MAILSEHRKVADSTSEGIEATAKRKSGPPVRALWLQPALAVLHGALALYMLVVAIAVGSNEQIMYKANALWTDGTITPDPSPAEPSITVSATWMLFFAEVATTANHILTYLSLTRGPTHPLGFLYYQDSSDGAWTLHGIKGLFFGEYSLSASLMTSVIFNVYSGYLDEKLPGIIISGVAVCMFMGAWWDFARWSSYQVKDSSVSRMSRWLSSAACLAVVAFLTSLWAPSFATVAESRTPGFVKILVVAQFVLYMSFGVAQLLFHGLTYQFGTLASLEELQPYLSKEIVVLSVLSAVSKALLLLILSVGAFF